MSELGEAHRTMIESLEAKGFTADANSGPYCCICGGRSRRWA